MKKEKIKKKKEEKVTIPFDEMIDKEMEALLLELHSLPHWQAILKLNRMYHNNVITTLSSVDPFKNPTQAARAQGTDVGLFSLEAKVNDLVKIASKDEDKIA